MSTFEQFKKSVIGNYEVIVKSLVGKLKRGDIIVKEATYAQKAKVADEALLAHEADLAKKALNSETLDGNTIADLIALLKNSKENTFETLSKNLKDYNVLIEYYDNTNKVKRMIYEFDNHTFTKDFNYYTSDGKLDSVVFNSTNFEINTIVSKNCKTLSYDLKGRVIGKIYTQV